MYLHRIWTMDQQPNYRQGQLTEFTHTLQIHSKLLFFIKKSYKWVEWLLADYPVGNLIVGRLTQTLIKINYTCEFIS